METAILYLLPDGTEFRYIDLNTVQDRVLIKVDEYVAKDKLTGKEEFFDCHEIVALVEG